jgi:hypothetical protein
MAGVEHVRAERLHLLEAGIPAMASRWERRIEQQVHGHNWTLASFALIIAGYLSPRVGIFAALQVRGVFETSFLTLVALLVCLLVYWYQTDLMIRVPRTQLGREREIYAIEAMGLLTLVITLYGVWATTR